MYIQQLYTNCLAEAAYYIESEGEAAIIDPIRETKPYLDLAKQRNAKIKYVFETHFHADFVSGHVDLAKQTGAIIVFGPLAETKYKAYNATDGEEFTIGKIKIKAVHTPGHTPESTCYLLTNEAGKEHAIFTGDTLFVGDVGRPDLLDGKMSKEELAGMLYESLSKKIKPLSDDVIVYPAHGAGSACGKNIGKETWSTIGEQKKNNYALQNITKQKFIQLVTEGLSAPPSYFFEDVMINKNGYQSIDAVIKNNLQKLSLNAFEEEQKNAALVIDARNADEFEKGFIPNSINIGLNGQFAIWAATIIDIKKPILLITEEGKEEEAITRLARVGYENVKGFLAGGFSTWLKANKPIEKIKSITAEELSNNLQKNNLSLLDVRKTGEYENGHLEGAEHICLSKLDKESKRIQNKSNTFYVYCAGGYRSMIACSLLKTKGFTNLVNIYGGFNSIKNTQLPIVSLAI